MSALVATHPAPGDPAAGPSGRRTVPPRVKQALGRVVAMAAPQCRFERSVFVLGHMRCGSTALSRVLCAHGQVSGLGEAHIAYRDGSALGQLLLALWRRGAWKPQARYLHDKLLHNRLDDGIPPEFAQARAVFLVREPGPAIRSIRHLFTAIGSTEYATDEAAADYYGARLARLERLWHLFPADRRLGFDFAGLTDDPAAALDRITGLLSLAEPLTNGYSADHVPTHGAGDPLASPRFSAIVPAAVSTNLAARPHRLDLPASRLAELEQQYRELIGLFDDSRG